MIEEIMLWMAMEWENKTQEGEFHEIRNNKTKIY